MIEEKKIDLIVESLEKTDFQAEWKKFGEQYPIITAYLLSEQFSLLSEEEFQLLWFAAMVIVKAFENEGISGVVENERLEALESANWALFDNANPSGFRNKLDAFFENTNQVDLLSFAEDCLLDDEDMQISSAAKEIIFVSLKSIIDLYDFQET